MQKSKIAGSQAAFSYEKKESFMQYAIKNKWLYIILAPTMLYLFIFNYIPIFGLVIAFKNFSFFDGILGSKWVGFQNFTYIFSTKDFWHILSNSVFISLLRLIWEFPFPIILAILLDELRGVRYKKFTQTVLYLPHFISWVVVGGIIMNFLSPTDGAINFFIKEFGGKPIAFLQKPEYFRSILIIAENWKEAGWGTIVYMAAMTSIDNELYEAAYIDGAGRIKKILYITLPCLVPTIVVLLIMNMGSILKNGFEQIFLLYSPSVYSVADVFETYTYRVGLLDGRLSHSTAVGMFQSVVGFVMLTITNLLSKKFNQSSLY